MQAPAPAATPALAVPDGRVGVLDGWRAISILLVLACHLLPLGPNAWQLNETAGPMGMALFFTLSGFLITRFLLHHDSVVDFMIRRLCRIVPLAWLGLLVALPMAGASAEQWWRNLLFVANWPLPETALTDVASHYWSLCVEMQFYVGIALLVAVAGRRGLYLLPVLCLAVTLHRIQAGTPIDIVTWRRVDEILAGCLLAMTVDGRFGTVAQGLLRRLPFWPLLLLFMASCHPDTGALNYLRPYLAALTVGVTLYSASPALHRVLEAPVMAYIAKVSFALYVIHHIFMYTWVGMDEDKIMKYVKRPLLFALTFGLAHLSTFYFEQRFIDWGRRISSQWRARRVPV